MKIKKFNKPKKILSIMALIEVLVLVIAITYSWTVGSRHGRVGGNEFEVIVGGDIYATQDGKSINSISNKGIVLAEASSVDGRNFYFPLSNNVSPFTYSMKFREGTSTDINLNYFQCDFELSAVKDNVPVYLDIDISETNVLAISPIRVSVNFNDPKIPVEVFSYAAGTFNAIRSIDNLGSPTSQSQNTVSFKEYVSSPLFVFENSGDTKNITVTIWLEGTEIAPAHTNYIADQVVNPRVKFFTA